MRCTFKWIQIIFVYLFLAFDQNKNTKRNITDPLNKQALYQYKTALFSGMYWITDQEVRQWWVVQQGERRCREIELCVRGFSAAVECLVSARLVKARSGVVIAA